MPEEFTDHQPPFTYSHNDLSATAIDDDPIGRQFPRSTKTACVRRRVPQLLQYAAGPDNPKTAEEYAKRGLPQLGLRITSFKDVTLVGLIWPHTLMDGAGQRDLLSAWSLALAGREEEIPTLLGASRDVAWDIAGQYADDEIDKLAVQDRLLMGLSRCRFITRVVWQAMTAPKADVRSFYVPASIIAGLRQEATDQLPDDPDTGKRAFVSDGDIVAAWFVRVIAKTEAKRSKFVMVGALDARHRVRELRQARGGGVHMQNLLGLYYAQFPGDVADAPLAHIALAHRCQVAQQSTEHQLIRHFMTKRKVRERNEDGGGLTVYCDEDDKPILCNNLASIGIADGADFGPAVLPNADGSYSSGKAAYYQFQSYPAKRVPRNSFIVLSKDSSGYWVVANVSQPAWAEIMHDIGVTDVE